MGDIGLIMVRWGRNRRTKNREFRPSTIRRKTDISIISKSLKNGHFDNFDNETKNRELPVFRQTNENHMLYICIFGSLSRGQG